MEKYKFNTIDEAVDDVAKGKIVILVDDEDRENEGDLCLAAEKITPESVNFMAKHGRGLICLSLKPERVEELKLPMMTDDNTSPFGTAFTVSIEAKKVLQQASQQRTGQKQYLPRLTQKQGRRTSRDPATSSL